MNFWGIILFFLTSLHAFSQSKEDSLWNIWNNNAASNVDRLSAMEGLATLYLKTLPDSAYSLADAQLNLAQKSGELSFQASALSIQGTSLRLQGNPTKAIKVLLQSNQIYEQLNNQSGIANNLHTIGGIYFDQKDFEKSLDYMNQALDIRKEIGDKYDIAKSYNSLGYMHDELGEYSVALEYHNSCLNIRKNIGDRQGESWCYNNMARVYGHMKEYQTAEEYYLKSILIKEELNEYTLGETKGNLGLLYLEMGKTNAALNLCEQGLNKSEEVGFEKAIRLNCNCLYKAHKVAGNDSKALFYHEKYISMRDSLMNSQNTRNLMQTELEYEYEMKEAMDKIENEKKLAIEKEKADKQRAISTGISVGAAILAIFLFVIIRSLRKTRIQKRTIEDQAQIVDQKNIEITDSIGYAQRIQAAIMTPIKVFQEHLPNSFILYKPKDIVAGDFYYFEKKGDLLIFAAADCTGHGVPGAMVSVVCNNALNRSIREFDLTDPGKILDKTRELVIEQFEKSEDEVKDGMDISICAVDLKSMKLRWAGANNPLWLIRNEEFSSIEPNKQPIGQYPNPVPFTSHEIDLIDDDLLYVFTDGYADQFGGEKGKKFKRKNLKKLLLQNCDNTMNRQMKIIDEAFEEWMGDNEQVDDVCVIGVRIIERNY